MTTRRVVAVAALIVLAIGLAIDVREVAIAFLAVYAAALSTVLGVMTVVLIAHLTTATWFRPFRPRAERVLQALPVLALLGVALLIASPVLYPWAGTSPAAHRYLNVPFFVARWIVYWVVWLGIARALAGARNLEARGEIERAAARFRVIAGAGLVLIGFTTTFASFDWMMSLTPDWASTIYGVYWMAGGLVGALALLAILVDRGEAGPPWPVVSTDDVHSLAKLLFTFILFWLYIGFAQFIVIWSAGLPAESSWYVLRANGGWAGLAVLLIFGHFVFPFLLLLFLSVKRSAGFVAAIGGALLLLRIVDAFWVVTPGVVPVRWWTAVVTAAMGVFVVATVVRGTATVVRGTDSDNRGRADGDYGRDGRNRSATIDIDGTSVRHC